MRYFSVNQSNFRIRATIILAAIAALSVAATQAQAVDKREPNRATRDQVARHGNEPGWTYGVLRLGEEREQIKSLPITARPYRPLHFYGNTVRRKHHRGTAVPSPRDLINAGAATVKRR